MATEHGEPESTESPAPPADGVASGEATGEPTKDQVLDPANDVAFPESVVQLFRGDIGQPYGGFPEVLQKKILGEEKVDLSQLKE